MNGFGYNLRLKVVFLVREHTHMRRKIAIDFHESQSRETVEPSICNLLHDLLISFIVNLGNQSLTLLLFIGSEDFAPTLSALASSMLSSVIPYSTPFRETRAISSVLAQIANFFYRILIHLFPTNFPLSKFSTSF